VAKIVQQFDAIFSLFQYNPTLKQMIKKHLFTGWMGLKKESFRMENDFFSSF